MKCGSFILVPLKIINLQNMPLPKEGRSGIPIKILLPENVARVKTFCFFSKESRVIGLRKFILTFLLIVSQSVFAQVSFSSKTDFTAGDGPISSAVGDFNRDGKLDMVTANYKSNTISIFLNTTAPGDTAPSFSARTDLTTGEHPMSVSIGDFNSDGKPDIAVVNYNSNTVSLFLNTTDPGANTLSFSARIDFPTGERPISISIGDFNGDGKPDIAVANYKSNTASIFLNTTVNGATVPTFSTKFNFVTGERPVSISIGDLNGDGAPDFAVANYRSNTVSVFLNTTVPNAKTPSFSTKIDFLTGDRPMAVSIGDINGDGKPDLVVGNHGANSVSVLLNATSQGAMTPSFAAKTDFTTGTNPQFVCIADLDSDGRLDLAVANYNSGTVSVFLNTTVTGAATSSFLSRKDFVTGVAPSSLSAGNLVGHGGPDLSVTNYGSNTISVLLNMTPLRRLPSN